MTESLKRTAFLEREERHRFLRSAAGALAFWLFAGTATLLISGFSDRLEVSALPSPVWVDFSDEATPTAERLGGGAPRAQPGPITAPTLPPPDQPTTELPSAPRLAAAKAQAPSTPSATPSPGPVASASAPSVPEGAATPGASDWVPGTRPQGSRVYSSSSGTSAGTAPADQLTTVVTGAEKGNSLETVLGARAGKAGRSLYEPIYLYMPLPKKVDDAVVGRVPSELRENFFKSYKRVGETWTLAREVGLGGRPELWLALEKGGYDLAKADYKAGGALRPVVLSFVVTASAGAPGTKVAAPRLEAVTLSSGSGDPAVDEAVLYGFARASFFNATDGTIAGSFTYRFAK